MAVSHSIRIKSRAGILQELLVGKTATDADSNQSGFTSLSYVKEVNDVGSGIFDVPFESGALTALESSGSPILDAQVEFWRADLENEIDPYCDFYGLLRDREYVTDDNGRILYRAFLAEQSDFLKRSIVAYRADVSNRSAFSAVATETILKTLVTRNATSSGTTADGRDRNVDSWGANISVAADTAAGTSLTIACMGRNLFEVLREVAELGGLNFSLVKTGAQTWQFRTATLLGTDRTSGASAVTFSLPYGNMRVPTLVSNRRSESTVVIAGGQGLELNRDVEIRTGANYNTLYNSFELFLNASQYSTAAGLQTAADERLEEVRARDTLTFDVIQVPSTLYGKHYFLGDKVNAFFLDFSYTPQLKRVSVDVRDRGENPPEEIQVIMADV